MPGGWVSPEQEFSKGSQLFRYATGTSMKFLHVLIQFLGGFPQTAKSYKKKPFPAKKCSAEIIKIVLVE